MKNNCEKQCRMTSQLKESNFCKKTFEIKNSKICFSCQENLKLEKDLNFYNCVFWDMKLFDYCNTCLLPCDKNKNANLIKKDKIKDDFNNTIKKIPLNYGMTYEKASKISNDLISSNNSEAQKNALETTSFAGTILSKVMNGKHIDISELKILKKFISKKIIKDYKK